VTDRLAASCCCSWARNAAAIGDYVAAQEPHAQPPISITYRCLQDWQQVAAETAR
jgi:hypothetical protein